MKFFTDKILQIHKHFTAVHIQHQSAIQVQPPKLSRFEPTTSTEVQKIIKSMPSKQCQLDPIPTWVIKLHLDNLAPIITKIINTSLENGFVHPDLNRGRGKQISRFLTLKMPQFAKNPILLEIKLLKKWLLLL